MESPVGLTTVHWDHEPTPNPAQEGNGQKCVLPSWAGSGVGGFMETLAMIIDTGAPLPLLV